MNSIVGFTASWGLKEERVEAAATARDVVLSHFEHLDQQSFKIGDSQLEVWGHRGFSDRVYFSEDGSVLALIGSPHGEVSWSDIQEDLRRASRPEDLELPWDGRFILVRISPDGERLTMWNDWIGSIPVFHAKAGRGRVASTLEPVVVKAAKLSSDDIFLPGLISLFVDGHCLADWTLLKGMAVMPPDCVAEWDEDSYCWKHLWTVRPSTDRWETGWDELVDEMHELASQAITDVLRTQPRWVLPLSSGLDSRLIAAVASTEKAELNTFTWGSAETTDVIFSRRIARFLNLPWKHVNLGTDYLANYTQRWAEMFGSAMHFHGMYQMSFLDALRPESEGPVLCGFAGDILAGDGIEAQAMVRSLPGSCQLLSDVYTHWSVTEVKELLEVPIEDALEELAGKYQEQLAAIPGAWFQKLAVLELWSRQRFFTSFQPVLCEYWRGTATPFLNRTYARFCLSLPRAALHRRRLLGDVYRRYYGVLATIPGTYAEEPFILTGRYLLKRRVAGLLPAPFRRGPFRGFDEAPLRLDSDCVRANGWRSLWPISEAWKPLSEWLDPDQITAAYYAAMASRRDIKPVRKLQSVQALAYRLLSRQA